nr:GNAT family N-acetyltransferase [uncultured Cohaesibacter sp.]
MSDLTLCPSGIVIRAATRSDFDAIARLHAASWRDAYKNFLPPSYLKERVEQDLDDLWARCRIKPDDLILVALDARNKNRLVGFISVSCQPDPYIDNLHCSPTETGKGIGKALMSAAFEQILFRKKQTASLTVITQNSNARNFYLHLGGRPVKARKDEIFGHPVDVELIRWDDISIVRTW